MENLSTPLLGNSEEVNNETMQNRLTLSIPQNNDPEDDEEEEFPKLKHRFTYEPTLDPMLTQFGPKIIYKYMYTYLGISLVSSILFAFILGPNLATVLSDVLTRNLLFLYIPYVAFLVASMIALILVKKVLGHVLLNEKPFELTALALFGYFDICASTYIGSTLTYIVLAASYLCRFASVAILYLIGKYVKSIKLRVLISLAVGGIEAIIINKFLTSSFIPILQSLMLAVLFSFSNILFFRLEKKFKIFYGGAIPRRTFCYTCIATMCVTNGSILFYFSDLAIYLNYVPE